MKIAVCGAQCVGKSTLIDDIIKEMPQFKRSIFTYRDAIKKTGIKKNINRKTNQDSQRIIFNAIAEETKRAEDNTILDRSVMDAVAYTIWPTRYKKGKTDITPQMVGAMKRTAIRLMDEYDLIIYIPVDDSIPLENDQLRDVDPKYRLQMAEIFEELLILDIEHKNFDKYGYKVVSISGNREERVTDFKQFIKTLKQ